MDETWLALRFERHRPRLRAVAHRMLGSADEAEDAVQEAWLRLARTDAGAIDNLEAWLVTTVSRISLNQLRTRRTRREAPLEHAPEPVGRADPEGEAVLADSVGLALLVVLEKLTPAERVSYVLHDMFSVPFEEIGAILERSPESARQLASRGRRRIRGLDEPEPGPAADPEVVAAFLAAARDGDFDALVAVLHPDVVLRAVAADGTVLSRRGATAVASGAILYDRTGLDVRVARIDGRPGWASYADGALHSAALLTVEQGRVSAVDIVRDPALLGLLHVEHSDG